MNTYLIFYLIFFILLLFSFQKSIPMRHKFYYIINAVPSVESLIMMCKSFVRKELIKKVRFYII